MEYSKHQFEGGVSGKDIKEAENHWALAKLRCGCGGDNPFMSDRNLNP